MVAMAAILVAAGVGVAVPSTAWSGAKASAKSGVTLLGRVSAGQ